MNQATVLIIVLTIFLIICRTKLMYRIPNIFALLWILIVLRITLLGRGELNEYQSILIPFYALGLIWRQPWISHSQYTASGFIGNVLLFIPLGLVLSNSDKKRVLVVPFLISLTIEIIQYSTRLGTFEVDDLICNTIGGIFGYELGKQISGQRKGNFIIPGIYLAALVVCSLKSILFN